MRYLIILLILFSSCKTRKVSTDIHKETTNTETISHAEINTEVKDKSKTTETFVDTSKTLITKSGTLTADRIEVDQTGKATGIGNAKYTDNTKVNQQSNVTNTKTIDADILTNKSEIKDSTVKQVTKIKDKVKQVQTKSYFILWLIIAIIVGIALFAYWKDIIKWFGR